MAEEVGTGKREPIGHYGKPLYGGSPVQDATKVICLVPQISMVQFQLKTLPQRGTMPFQDYRQFIELCDQSTLEDKAKIYEFYLHKLALTDY